MQTKTNHHIVVAAGSGARYGSDLPKQFCLLAGRPLLMTTLERLHAATPEWEITVVLSSAMMPIWNEMCREAGFTLPHSIVAGGATRAESVRNAVRTINTDSAGYISVHDAARPCIPAATIEALVAALESDPDIDGALPSTPLTDTIRSINPDGTSTAADRARFRAVQTPQIFPAAKLAEAYRQPLLATHTDDASVMESAGYKRLVLTEGDPRNIKVTNPGDMAIAELYLKSL